MPVEHEGTVQYEGTMPVFYEGNDLKHRKPHQTTPRLRLVPSCVCSALF